jgi:hypothetical protein
MQIRNIARLAAGSTFAAVVTEAKSEMSRGRWQVAALAAAVAEQIRNVVLASVCYRSRFR